MFNAISINIPKFISPRYLCYGDSLLNKLVFRTWFGEYANGDLYLIDLSVSLLK